MKPNKTINCGYKTKRINSNLTNIKTNTLINSHYPKKSTYQHFLNWPQSTSYKHPESPKGFSSMNLKVRNIHPNKIKSINKLQLKVYNLWEHKKDNKTTTILLNQYKRLKSKKCLVDMTFLMVLSTRVNSTPIMSSKVNLYFIWRKWSAILLKWKDILQWVLETKSVPWVWNLK